MTTHTRRRIVTAVVAATGAATLSLALAAQDSTGASAQMTALATSLCFGWDASGPEFVVAGPRVQLTRKGDSNGAAATRAALFRVIADTTDLLVAAANKWVVIAQTGSTAGTILDCETRTAHVFEHDASIDRLAVSSIGNVAVHTREGAVSIQLTMTGRSGDNSPHVIDAGHHGGVDAFFWSNAHLLTSQGSHLSLIDPTATGYTGTEVPIGGAFGAGRVLFVYNGLLYLLDSTSCLDVFIGSRLTQRLRRVSCLPATSPTATYSVDQTTIAIMAPTGETIWKGSRPTVMTARVKGTTREIAVALNALASLPTVPTVPLDTPTSSREGFDESIRLRAELEWKAFFSSGTTLEPMFIDATRSILSKGWTDPHRGPTGEEAVGVAMAWRAGVDFLAPNGSSLQQLAALHWSPGARAQEGAPPGYTDAQINAILPMNRSLGSTLEGTLFQRSWIPIGAISGREDELPPAFSSAQLFRGQLTETNSADRSTSIARLVGQLRTVGNLDECQSNPLEDFFLASSFDRGVPFLGRLNDAGVKDINSRSGQVSTSALKVLTCNSNGNGGAFKLLIAQGAKLRLDGGGAWSPLATSPLALDLRYRRNDSSEWPVLIEGDVLLGVGAPDSSDDHSQATLVRSWLNRLFTKSDRVESVLLPVNLLEVSFTAQPQLAKDIGTVPNVTLISGEVTPSLARSGVCEDAAAATGRRQAYDELIGLAPSGRSARIIDQFMIGIAENAVDRHHAIFTRDNGTSVWVVADEAFGFQPLKASESVPVSSAPADRAHGTEVASIIVAQHILPGVLSDANLVWLDLTSAPDQDLLNVLKGTFSVINISHKLEGPAWIDLETKMATGWSQGLLLIAAAKDKTGEENGAPLDWKQTKTNVMGVGVARFDELLPASPVYSREYIDLIAPGDIVPAVHQNGSIECVSGTSFATAYVSAIAALVANSARGSTAAQVRARLIATAKWRDAYGNHVKGGLIDARRALDGITDNIVLVEQAGQPPLDAKITFDAFGALSKVRISGDQYDDAAPGGTSPRMDDVPWPNVLRLQRTDKGSDENGSDARFRVTYIDNSSRVVILQSATLRMLTRTVEPKWIPASMPIKSCTDRTSPNSPVTCSATRVAKIIDYAAAISRAAIVGF